MKFTVTRLDRRHNGHTQFSHYVTPVWSSQLKDKIQYFEWRNWCWATWGPGLERDVAIEFGSDHYHIVRWAWQVDKYSKRLYFQSEKELNWFVLTWSTE
jgi:hypothetical protein